MGKQKNFTASNTKTKVALFGSIGLVIAGLTAATYNIPSSSEPSAGAHGSTMYPSSLVSIGNGCGDISRFKIVDGMYGQIPEEVYERPTPDGNFNIPSHPMIIPVYGYMADRGLPEEQLKFYTAKDEKIPRQVLLRTMWDSGTTVIWYNSKATSNDLFQIQKYVESHSNVVAVPWNEEREIPLNRNIAMSTWGISQSCLNSNETVVEEFQQFADFNQVKHESAPPEANLSRFGTLLPIQSDRLLGENR